MKCALLSSILLWLTPVAVGDIMGLLYRFEPEYLPAQTPYGGRVLCENHVLKYRHGRTVIRLAASCPKSFYGVVDSGVYARFGNGIYFISYDGSASYITNAIPSAINCVIDDKVVATFGNGVYVLLPNGGAVRLYSGRPNRFFGCLRDAAIVVGLDIGLHLVTYDKRLIRIGDYVPENVLAANRTGLLAAYGNGLFFVDWNGMETRIGDSAPTRVIDFGADDFLACFPNGLFLVNFKGKHTFVSGNCNQ